MAKQRNAANETSPHSVTQRLVQALGEDGMAALLGVDKDCLGRWRSGEDVPNKEHRNQLARLDAFVSQLHAVFTSDQARLWLQGHDPHLGARPIDVYRLEGAAPVIEAIRAHQQGIFE